MNKQQIASAKSAAREAESLARSIRGQIKNGLYTEEQFSAICRAILSTIEKNLDSSISEEQKAKRTFS